MGMLLNVAASMDFAGARRQRQLVSASGSATSASARTSAIAAPTCRPRSTASPPTASAVLECSSHLRHRPGRGDPRPAVLPERVPADRDRARARASCSTPARRSSASWAAQPGGVRHGPRPIDVDVLMLGELEHRSERLTLPHEQVLSRRFVLIPLLELDFELATPAGERLADALATLADDEGVRRAGPAARASSRIIRRCSSSSTSATRRRISARSATARSSSTGASRPTAARPPTSWARRCAACSSCAGCRSRTSTPRRSPRPCRSSRPSGRRRRGATSATRCWSSGPGVRTGMPIRLDNPRELGADRLVNAVAAWTRFAQRLHRRRLRHRDHLRRRLGRGRVPRRDHRPGHRDLARGARAARGEALAGRARRAARADRQDHRRRGPLGDHLRLRRPGRRHRRPAARRARRRGPGDRHRRPRAPSRARRSPRRSTIVDDLLTLEGLRLIWEHDSSASRLPAPGIVAERWRRANRRAPTAQTTLRG